MTTKLWRFSPRSISAGSYGNLVDVFTHSDGGFSVEPAIAADLYFGPAPPPVSIGAFTIAAPLVSLNFVSSSLVGPTPGVVPAEWLKRDDIRKVVLVELDYRDQVGSGNAATPVTRTRYLANEAYFDDENSRIYHDCVTSVPRYNRAINRATLRGRYTASIGSLELSNDNGEFDDLLGLACDGSEVRFYIGDAGDVMSARRPWLRSQFLFVFSAVAVVVTAPSFGRISIALKDSTLLMDKMIGGNVPIGGTDVNADKFRPKNFGLIENGAAVLIAGSSLTYGWNEDGLHATLLAVRCRGQPIAYTDNLDGTFRLLADPVGGQVTYDGVVETGAPAVAHGDMLDTFGAYRGSDMFYQLVGVDAGLIAAGKFAGASSNFELNGANDYHVGRNFAEGTPLPEALNEWCDTMNAYYGVRRDGQVTYGWMRPEALDYELPPAAWTLGPAVTNDDLMKGTEWRIDHADPGFYFVQGYANINWTPQTDLATGLSATAAELYRRKAYYIPAESGAGVGSTTSYSGPSDPPGYGTFKYGNPQLFHLTLKKSLENRTLISCRSDRDAFYHLGRWQFVARAQQLPNLEFIDATVDLSYFQVELGNVLPLTIIERDERVRYGISAMRFQVCSVDIALTENLVRLGFVRRRPAIVDVYYGSILPSSDRSIAPPTGAIAIGGLPPTVVGALLPVASPLVIELLFTDGAGSATIVNTGTLGPYGPFQRSGQGTVMGSGGVGGGGYLQMSTVFDGGGNCVKAYTSSVSTLQTSIRLNDFEISCYCRFRAPISNRWGYVFWGWQNGNPQPILSLESGTGKLYFSDGTISYFTGYTEPGDNVWRKFTLRRVNGVAYVFVDSALVFSVAYAADCNAGSFTTTTFEVASAGNSAGGFSNADMDEFRFYNGSVVNWNTLDKSSNTTLSNNNRTATASGAGAGQVRSFITHSSGKYYFEARMDTGNVSSEPFVGIKLLTAAMASQGPFGGEGDYGTFNASPNTGYIAYVPGSNVASSGPATAAGDVLMYAVDFTAGKIWMGRNGTWLGSGDPAAGTGQQGSGIAAGNWALFASVGGVIVTGRFTSTDLTYGLPAGFVAWDGTNTPPAVTWNPADKGANVVLSNGNLTATNTLASTFVVRATVSHSTAGKFYYEAHIDSVNTHHPEIGIADSAHPYSTNLATGGIGNAWSWQVDNTTLWHNGSSSSSGANFTTGDVIAVAIDFAAGKLWFAKNNVWILSGNPAAGTGEAFSSVAGTLFPAVGVNGCAVTARFSRSTFVYAPPTGFLAWDGT